MTETSRSARGAARSPRAPLRVLVAGGGVAALEAVLALRDIAEERVSIELLAAEPRFWYRPLAVVEPFGLGHLHGIELVDLTRAAGAELTLGALVRVDADRHTAYAESGLELEYDVLLVATGAVPTAAVPGAFTFRGPADSPALGELLSNLEPESVRHLVFTLPVGVSWPLPVYELALLTAAFLAQRGLDRVALTVVTPEDEPLGLFGADVSTTVRALLDERDVSVLTGRYPISVDAGALTLVPGGSVPADVVVALPRLEGARIDGLPRDVNGFLPTDPHGRVRGVGDVFAAGDVTSFPVKQGGLAAQQARAAAEAIAALAGADVDPQPFRPVLRGLLLTGRTPAYLRAELGGGAGETSVAATEPLWWPPGKIVGRHLAPFLAERAGLVLAPPAGVHRLPVDVDLTSAFTSL